MWRYHPFMTNSALPVAEVPAGVGTFGPGPFNKFEDFSLYDRCITRGIAWRSRGSWSTSR